MASNIIPALRTALLSLLWVCDLRSNPVKGHCRSYCEPLTLSLAVAVLCLVVLQLLRLALGTEFPEYLALPDGLCRRIPQGKVRLVPVTVFSAWVRCTVPD